MPVYTNTVRSMDQQPDSKEKTHTQPRFALTQLVSRAFATVKSVLAAFIGVSTDKLRQKDAQSRILPYIITGIVLTVVLIASFHLMIETVLDNLVN